MAKFDSKTFNPQAFGAVSYTHLDVYKRQLKITSISVDKGVLCWVWIEEAYEITNEDDFNKLDLSIRGEVPEGYFKQITLTLSLIHI